MLPRRGRLRRSEDIQRVVRSGRCISLPGVRICVLPNQVGVSRIACIAGKKIDRSAVGRHRIQRWLRAVARQQLTRVPAEQGYDMVWLARPDVRQYSSARQLEQMIDQYAPIIMSRLFSQAPPKR